MLQISAIFLLKCIYSLRFPSRKSGKKNITKRGQHEVVTSLVWRFVAVLEPYQGRLYPAVVRGFDVVPAGRAFERGTFKLGPRCELDGGGFTGTTCCELGSGGFAGITRCELGGRRFAGTRLAGPEPGPRGMNPLIISFSKLDGLQNIRRRQIVNVVFESAKDEIKSPVHNGLRAVPIV